MAVWALEWVSPAVFDGEMAGCDPVFWCAQSQCFLHVGMSVYWQLG
jgi:hypothetical protein